MMKYSIPHQYTEIEFDLEGTYNTNDDYITHITIRKKHKGSYTNTVSYVGILNYEEQTIIGN